MTTIVTFFFFAVTTLSKNDTWLLWVLVLVLVLARPFLAWDLVAMLAMATTERWLDLKELGEEADEEKEEKAQTTGRRNDDEMSLSSFSCRQKVQIRLGFCQCWSPATAAPTSATPHFNIPSNAIVDVAGIVRV